MLRCVCHAYFPVLIAKTQMLVFLKNSLQNISLPLPQSLACGFIEAWPLWFLQLHKVKKKKKKSTARRLNTLGLKYDFSPKLISV